MSFVSVLAANTRLLYTQAITASGLASTPVITHTLARTIIAALTLVPLGAIGYGFYVLAKKLRPAEDIPPQKLKNMQTEIDAARLKGEANAKKIQAEFDAAILKKQQNSKQVQSTTAYQIVIQDKQDVPTKNKYKN